MSPTKTEKRAMAQEVRRKASATRMRNRALVWTALALAAVGAGAFGLKALLDRPGQRVAEMGREHVSPGTALSYTTNPPTSGPHYADSARPGIYSEPVDDGLLVHSLEHGYVILWYACGDPSLASCQELAGSLARVARAEGLWKVIVVPRPGMDTPVVLTAWQRIDPLPSFDERRIVRFIRAWRDKGPEKTPD